MRQLLQAPAVLRISGKSASASQQSVMPSKFSLRLLSAAMLAAALPLCAAAPLQDSSAGDSSGAGEREGEDAPCVPRTAHILNAWEKVIEPTNRHRKEFEEEFSSNVEYRYLEKCKQPSFPPSCPQSNFSREACLQRLTEGLLVYTVLLKHVEKEYPNNSILHEISADVPLLVPQVKGRMRSSEGVAALTSSQEEKLLKELDSPDTFKRKMRAHSILYHLRLFLINGKRSFRNWQKSTKHTGQLNVAGVNCNKVQKDMKG